MHPIRIGRFTTSTSIPNKGYGPRELADDVILLCNFNLLILDYTHYILIFAPEPRAAKCRTRLPTFAVIPSKCT
jgi:hypothetical protein